MSLSGSSIVNHGPLTTDAEVLIPLGHGQVNSSVNELIYCLWLVYVSL